MSRRGLGLGIGLAAVYALVALGTTRLSPGPTRPLFDGFAPPPPYRWVNPPPELARDNQRPEGATAEVELGEQGSKLANVTTPDGQAVASLEVGSVPPHPPDASVTLDITPLDAATLAALPQGLRAQSNAYRIMLTYRPSGIAVVALAKPGTVALTAGAPTDILLFSPDGVGWERKPSRPYGHSQGLFSSLESPGYYLATTSQPAASDNSRARSPFVYVLFAVLALVPLAAAYLLLGKRSSRRPHRPPAATRRRAAGSSAAGRKPAPKNRRRQPKRRRRR